MTTPILIDSNYLIALNDLDDRYHEIAMIFEMSDKSPRIIPDVILAEVWHNLLGSLGHRKTMGVMGEIARSAYRLEPITKADLARAYEIMRRYEDSRLDLVDCCIFALAERLKLKQVCSFDRRDFLIFRNEQGEALELLP